MSSSIIDSILANNKEWSKEQIEADNTVFERSAQGQAPKILWIGCCDSRVPETTITKLGQGAMFTHRNIANIVNTKTDLSIQSVIECAIDYVKIEHVVICGHTACLGCQTALQVPIAPEGSSSLQTWINLLRDIKAKHENQFKGLEGDDAVNKLVEINVRESQLDVANSESVRKAWKAGRPLTIHGLVFDLQSGLLKRVTPIISGDKDL